MRVAVLGSGSNGNSLIVESRGRRLLVDSGFSCREIERRLRELGEDAARLDAILLTHEHNDHVGGADRLVRRHAMPIYATAGTLRQAKLGSEALAAARTIRSGRRFEVPARGEDGREGPAGFLVEPFRVPHDASEPVGFVIEDDRGCRLGVISDIGSRSQLAWGRLHDLDGLVLETNYDLQMLRSGPYPWHLKQRVAGRHGHLSNHDAAAGLPDLVDDRLQWVALYHLSRTNNLPALAAQAVGETLDKLGSSAQLTVTEQNAPSPWLETTVGSGGQLWLA